MTAPLPPPTGIMRVPMIDDECNHRGCRDVPAWDADAVKLAVREALERALSSVILRGKRDPSDVIRTIIKEYK